MRTQDTIWTTPTSSDPGFYAKKTEKERELGRELSTEEFLRDYYEPEESLGAYSGISVFDPVLCELVCRWFSPAGGLVLDPFAGGSVRGIVASKLGRRYVGIDLSERQVEANREQAKTICDDPVPTWVVGDARKAAELFEGEADLVFTCPPYLDLEVYSDDERDLSTMDPESFFEAYREAIFVAVSKMAEDSFAVFVVGDVRDREGFYYGLPARTVEFFEAAGARLYNEAVLVTAVASLSMRTGKQFEHSRKLGKTHQNVLVFCRGSAKTATAKIGDVEFGAPPEETNLEETEE